MENVLERMKELLAASPRENSATQQQKQQQQVDDRHNNRNGSSSDGGGSGGGGGDSDLTSCNYCIGVSVYTKAMLDMREPPRCRGLEIEVGAPRDRVELLKNRAPAPRTDEFTYIGLGVSVYSKAWMYEGKKMPLVKGLGVIAVEKDENDIMKAIEERKRVMRELERERRRRNGDLDDGYDDEDDGDDDDDDFDLVEELFGDDEAGDDASALVEKDPLSSVGKPRLPPLLPVFTVEDLVSKSVESAKYSANAMYNFWAKRLDGIGERYVESCQRIFVQMEKQATSVPQNCMWLVHQIEKTVTGTKGGDDDKK